MYRLRALAVAASLLTFGTVGHAAQAQEPAPDERPAATETRPADDASTPSAVFPTLLPEGGHIAPQPPTPEEQQEAQRERSLAGVRASLDNLRRMGLFAGESGVALLLAGLAGIAIAIVVTVIRSRSRGFPRR